MARNWTLVSAGAALLLAAASTASTAFAAPERGAAAEGCHEIFAMVGGDEAAIRAAVPLRYDLARDAAGRPLVLVNAIRCRNMVIDGTDAGPNTITQLSPIIRSPSGAGCVSDGPLLGTVAGDAVPGCSRYVIFWDHSNRAAVDWLRAGTPGFPARQLVNFSLDDGELALGDLGSPFHFSAGPPTQSFRIDAVYRDRPGAVPFFVEWFAQTRTGIVRVTGQGDLSFGDASGAVEAEPGSEVARMLGASRREFEAPGSLVGSVWWERFEVRKEFLKAQVG